MDRISRFNIVHRLQKGRLLIAINALGCLAIFFFGYDQGMMGSVNVSIDYAVRTMKFGYVEDGTKQVKTLSSGTIVEGGIVSWEET